uniref:Uncharacterized protein n=1 Tax=Alexandrium andersonii TaxID=327968 RepID=A0A7S2G4H8_9DINO
MAPIGAPLQHWVKFPGFETVPSGLKAVITPPGTFGFAALVLISGILELFVWTQRDERPVGDFGDPAKIGYLVPSESGEVDSPDFRNRELNNGRFAMFAAIGIIVAELATGKDAVQQLG